jgi:aryl-alcohol dehydrogenase-like predicted oxidoreductase
VRLTDKLPAVDGTPNFRGLATKLEFGTRSQWEPQSVGLYSRPEPIKQVAEGPLKRLRIDAINLFHQHCVCQDALTPTTRHVPTPRIQHTYAEYERVTDGARTRDLRSHNPI